MNGHVPTFRVVLTARLSADDSGFNIVEGDEYDAADRAHLERWVDGWADDPVWEELAADARSRQFIHENLIWYALQTRRIAESVRGGDDRLLRENQKRHAELLELAIKAKDLARYFEEAQKYSGIANFWHRFLQLPLLPEQDRVSRWERSDLRVQQLRQIHEQEAELLLRLAGRAPKPTTKIRREANKRHITAFIHLMTDHIKSMCYQQHNDAVAILADIAFPGHDIDAETVRKTLQPSRRVDRALRALNRRKT